MFFSIFYFYGSEQKFTKFILPSLFSIWVEQGKPLIILKPLKDLTDLAKLDTSDAVAELIEGRRPESDPHHVRDDQDKTSGNS
jgi:hypothetical protein